MHKLPYVKGDGQTDGRTDRQTDRQADRQTDKLNPISLRFTGDNEPFITLNVGFLEEYSMKVRLMINNPYDVKCWCPQNNNQLLRLSQCVYAGNPANASLSHQ